MTGLALDGHGYGPGGAIWGGERIDLDGATWTHKGGLRPLPLAGGDKAAREPWRMGVGALYQGGREDLARALFARHPMAEKLISLFGLGMRVGLTSSMGRLFDAAAGDCGRASRPALRGTGGDGIRGDGERAGGACRWLPD